MRGWARVRRLPEKISRKAAGLAADWGRKEEFRMVLRVMIAEVHKGWDPELSSGQDDSKILSANEGRC